MSRCVRATAAVLVLAATTVATAEPEPAGADTHRTRYGIQSVACTITDSRLAGTSGLATAAGTLYATSDVGPVGLYALDDQCRVVRQMTLAIPPAADRAAVLPQTVLPGAPRALPGRDNTDVEDLAAGPDGSVWLADIGGNRARRVGVSLYRWPGSGLSTVRYDLRYPDGSHDAEALLVSLLGQVLIVAKTELGRANVYAAPRPLGRTGTLVKVAQLNLGLIRPPGVTGPASVLVTGGAVAPDGIHFALRTYTTAYEWDAPDGDLIAALRGAKPRVIPLARDRQGEAIAYAKGGQALLTTGELLPAPVRRVPITRDALPITSSAPVLAPASLAGGFITAALIGLVMVVGRERRRWARRATTYQAG